MATIHQITRRQRYTVDAILLHAVHRALVALVDGFANELDLPPLVALRQPVSMGAVLLDLYTLLGVEPPAVIMAAVGDQTEERA